MRWSKRENRRQEILNGLRQHSATVRDLPGIATPAAREALATQFIASERREDYYRMIQAKPMSVDRADPIILDSTLNALSHITCRREGLRRPLGWFS